ncbi:hypothetical protein VTO42DRAFT_4226 [Malbranchea cinnamomea]
MDPRRYSSPRTPRNRRGCYTLSHHGWDTPRQPQSWHGPSRGNHIRRGLPRYRGSYRYRGYPRSAERENRRDTRPYRQQSHPQHDDSPFNFRPEPVFSPFSDKEEWLGGNDLLGEPRKIPMIISPNARETSFSEIMNGAFDLDKSPMGLGRRLAATTQTDAKELLLQSPFGIPPAPEKTQLDMSTPTCSSKRHASSQIGNIEKQIKSLESSSKPDTGRNPASQAEYLDSVSLFNQTNPATVTFMNPRMRAPTQPPDFAKLLEMVQRNAQQSKELVDLVTNYINRHSADAQEKAPVLGSFGTQFSEDIISKTHVDTAAQTSTLACGGDSPDPPRDNSKVCRGHMIDRIDIISKSPLKTPDPGREGRQVECQSACPPNSPGGNSPTSKHGGTSLDVSGYSFHNLAFRSRHSGQGPTTRDFEHVTHMSSALSPHAHCRSLGNLDSNSSTSGGSGGLTRWRDCLAPSPDSEPEFLDVPLWGNRHNPAPGSVSEAPSSVEVFENPDNDLKVAEITPPGSSNISTKTQGSFSDRENENESSIPGPIDIEQCESGNGRSTEAGAKSQASGPDGAHHSPDSRTRDKRSRVNRKAASSSSGEDAGAVHGELSLVTSNQHYTSTMTRCNPGSPCWRSGSCGCTPLGSPKSLVCPACGRPKERDD